MSARTDRGLRRPANEDASLLRSDRGLLAVADGMGGHAAGDVASGLAVEAVERSLAEPAPADLLRLDDAARRLADATEAANRAILDRAEREPDKAGMGTTLTTLALVPSERGFAIAHVGDSRAYLLRDGSLSRLTTDHTWVQRQVDRGSLTPEQARSHPLASVLTRALGGEPAVEVELRTGRVAAGDLFLLCSDGLTGMVEDADLEAMLQADATPDEQADRLIEAAKLRGGHDNITVGLCRVAE